MPDTPEPAPPPPQPTLDDEQMGLVARYATARHCDAGAVLFEPGQRNAPLLVVRSGRVEVHAQTPGEERRLVSVCGPGQLVGDLEMFTGQATQTQGQAAEASDLYVLEREPLRQLINEQAALGELILQTLMERRESMSGRNLGLIKVLGSCQSEACYGVRDFLTRNDVPHRFIDLDEDREADALMQAFEIGPRDMPVVISPAGLARRPSLEDLARQIGLIVPLDDGTLYDVVVVGGGPAGLGAAVYAASEGLRTLVIESRYPGGQAGASARIENYLGFPTGVSGDELTASAVLQAQKFGATLLNPRRVTAMDASRPVKKLTLDDDSVVRGRAVVLACGGDYRRLGGCTDPYEGQGVYYGTTYMEPERFEGQSVAVVGGGNSAGQAAVFLAEHAQSVHLIVRDDWGQGLSRYLQDRIESIDRIHIHEGYEVVDCQGEPGLERVVARPIDAPGDGGEITLDTVGLFIMIGVDPRTDWLRGCVGLDGDGFIVTGTDAGRHPDYADHWDAPDRTPAHLETTRPGVFAVGDVRSGATKRVAAAIGEGGMAVTFCHRALKS